MTHFFIHNSFHSGDVILTRAVIQAVRISFSGVKITLECPEVSTYLWQDLDLPIALYQGSEYQGTEPTPNCPPDAIFVNMWFGVFDDILKLYGMTYQNNVHTFNRQMYQQHLNHKYLLPIPIYTPMITFLGQPEKEIEVRENSILVENGVVFSHQNYFYLNEHLKQIASDFPQLNFYCSDQPKFTASNIIDCSGMNLKELSQVGDKCIGLLMKGSAINAASQTEINRYKPRCIVGWDLPEKLWDNLENPVVYAKNYGELKAFLSSLGVAENTALPDSVIFTPSLRKPRGLFLNTVKANCSIYESGKMAYECLLLSGKYELEYLEISQTACEIPNNYEFYIFNYHHQTMSWLNTKKVGLLPGLKATLVLETLTNNPFVLCPAEDFDAYLAIDPTMKVADKRVYAFPRPLEVPTLVTPYRESSIPVIGTFGFATVGKGFELVVDAVNKEFKEAIVRINIPTSTYGDPHMWKMYQRNYAEYLSELCNKVAKNGVQVIITNEFLTKDQLIEWCSQNTLNCFLYNRNQPGLSATTDQAISSGRPLAISANETFRHIHRYIKPYPFQSLRDAIASSVPQVQQMQKDWHPQNFAIKFEEVLEDFGVLPKTERKEVQIKVEESPKTTILIVSHKQKQCGIYQYGVNITEALQKSDRYAFAYAECSNYTELKNAVAQTNPAAIIYNYYQTTMPWLTKEMVRQYQIPQLGIMHDFTQEDADKVTRELFDWHLCPDPTLVENNPIVFKTKRLVPAYINSQNVPNIVTIGSFGFGFSDQGCERLVSLVQEELERAKIVLHLPFNNVVDRQGQYALATAENCRKIISKTGIELIINHEFLSKQQLLNFLASNTINAFLYDPLKYRGLSTVIDWALAVQRPIAVTKTKVLRHLSSVISNISVEHKTLKEIIQNGVAPLVPFYNEWSEDSFIVDYENILNKVLANPNHSRNQQTSVTQLHINAEKKGLCKFLKSKTEVNESTKYLKERGYVSHRLGCKDWDLANIIEDLSDGNLLDMGSSDSYLLKNALIKGLRGYKYGIDLQKPDVPLDEVKYFTGNLMDTGLPDKFFQNITCLSVLEHEVDIKRFASEVSRILAEQGKLYITVDYWNPKVVSKLRIFDKQWNIFDKSELVNLIQECKEKNLHLVDEVDWSLGEAVINPNYHSPDLSIQYTFGMLVFQKK
ncbi:methyltransferase domain-containing protein [Microcoleus sp. T2B6]|uniref:methyltransferase domain-containing protein n=1 Tax=Microcoleus sp. T2B6 TaxID=3055424 RepID=UPI002FD0337B